MVINTRVFWLFADRAWKFSLQPQDHFAQFILDKKCFIILVTAEWLHNPGNSTKMKYTVTVGLFG